MLLDFGLASPLSDGARARHARRVHGSLAYMAPEQFWDAAAGERGRLVRGRARCCSRCSPARCPSGARSRSWSFAKQSHAAAAPVATCAANVPPALDEVVVRLLDRESAAAARRRRMLRACWRGDAPPRERRRRCRCRSRAGRSSAATRSSRCSPGWLDARARRERRRSSTCAARRASARRELVQRFLGDARRATRRWFSRGRCHPQESVPYKAMDPLVDELSLVLLERAGTTGAGAAAGAARRARRLFPVLERVPAARARGAAREPTREPQELRRQGIRGAARAAGRGSPAPRRWCCGSTTRSGATATARCCCARCCARPDAPRVLLLLTYRAEEARDARCSTSSTRPADEAARPRATSSRSGRSGRKSRGARRAAARRGCARRRARRCTRGSSTESAGSPFFVGELVRYLAQQAATPAPPSTCARHRAGDRARASSGCRHRRATLLGAGGGRGRPDRRRRRARGGRRRRRGLAAAARPVRPVPAARGRRARRSSGEPRDLPRPHARDACWRRSSSPSVCGTRHRQLAETLLRRARSPIRRLLAAALPRRRRRAAAAEHALRAAGQAAAALAFDRAAELYAMALRLRGERDAGLAAAVQARADARGVGRSVAAAARLRGRRAAARRASRTMPRRSRRCTAARPSSTSTAACSPTACACCATCCAISTSRSRPIRARRCAPRSKLRLRFLLRGPRVAPIDPERVSPAPAAAPRRAVRRGARHGDARPPARRRAGDAPPARRARAGRAVARAARALHGGRVRGERRRTLAARRSLALLEEARRARGRAPARRTTAR